MPRWKDLCLQVTFAITSNWCVKIYKNHERWWEWQYRDEDQYRYMARETNIDICLGFIWIKVTWCYTRKEKQ